ncbi:restriction endonuclease subunit S [Hymenobacter baengnokdamensis]|uniref:restriction endonuclease subunit S n=1 Tax=Hymenobacter baengnokdamensis TaxID=2615203 RepID=UPI001248ED73|nr:restriction endonuclease subunit S [Hymenobacter baengnokdamensis]
MQSNYEPIGKFIRLVDVRNRGLRVTQLLGLSISKQFIPSVANIIGTDMENYKIIRKNQFACSTMQVRRDKKMPVALLKEVDEAIISQAYPVFEVIDENELLPEYLMMWFTRQEFDREACFHAVGGVRGSLEWEDFINLRLPVPSIAKQREIVAEYHTIQNRIALNNQLIQTLETTAQAIYKQWFVEFEFPNETGQPYKSSGGEMEDSELGEIPKGWEVINVKQFCVDMKSGGTPSRDIDAYWDRNDVPWLKTGEIKNNILLAAEEYISTDGLKNSSAKLLPKDTVLMSMYGVNAGDIGLLKFVSATNQACCGMICENPIHSAYLYYHLLHNQEFISSQAIGGAQENLSKNFIEKISILNPAHQLLERTELKIIVDNRENLTKQNSLLNTLANLLLSKLATIETAPSASKPAATGPAQLALSFA